MVGSVPPANPAPPVFRNTPARAPIARVQRELDLIGAPPQKQVRDLVPIGRMGTRPFDVVV